MGAGVHQGHGPHEAAGGRVLRRHEFRPIREALSRTSKALLTDLLIGDLFKDEVDEVVEPMEAIRAEMKA